MKKLYYLDESEKNRILEMHNTMTKNQYLLNESAGTEQDPYKGSDLDGDVKKFVNWLDVWADERTCYDLYNIAVRLNKSWYLDDINENDKKLINALAALAYKYEIDESGNKLLDDLQNTGTMTWSTNGVETLQKLKNVVQQALSAQPKPLGGSTAGGCKGWDWTKVQQKYPCTSPDMFFDTKPVCSQYGDYLRANINNVEYSFFIGDGHLYDKNNKDLGFYACKSGKLEKTSAAYMDKTNADMTPQMESKKREFVRMITEAGWGAVDSSSSSSSSNTGNRNKKHRQSTGGNSITNVQNKIVELDSTYKPTGSMDQATINKIMNLLTNGNKPAEQKPAEYQVTQVSGDAKSGD